MLFRDGIISCHSVFKCIHGMSPFYLSDCITMCSEAAIRNARASTSHNLLMVPYAPLDIFKSSFSYRGPETWNALPECIRTCTSLNSFKKALKAHVLM